MIKKPSEGTYLGRIIKRAQYFFDSLARYIHFYQTLFMSPPLVPLRPIPGAAGTISGRLVEKLIEIYAIIAIIRPFGCKSRNLWGLASMRVLPITAF